MEGGIDELRSGLRPKLEVCPSVLLRGRSVGSS